jgi:protein TonB
VAVAGGSFAGLDDLLPARAPRGRGTFIGTIVAVALHGGIAAALLSVDTARLLYGEKVVEMDVQEPPPPPPDIKPPPPPPPPPPEPTPRIVTHRPPPMPAAPPAPPPPNQEPPPKAAAAPPVFGVSMSSTVGGDGPGMAVPVGNTLMTRDRTASKGPPAAYPVEGTHAPAPVPEIFISELPRVLTEVKVKYPEEAQRLRIEGTVKLRLSINEKGEVTNARVTTPAGHGFDEAAREAFKTFKFSPPRTSDGRAVPTTITYTYTFELTDQ